MRESLCPEVTGLRRGRAAALVEERCSGDLLKEDPGVRAASRGARERQAGKTGGSHTPPAVQRRCMCSVRPAAVGVELARIEGQVGHGALCCWVISREMAMELFPRQLETQD